MFNLQQFLKTHAVTITNLETLLKNGVKTVKLYDEECNCFGENTVDIQQALDEIEQNDDGFMCINNERHYWHEESVHVGSTGYNVFFTAEEALAFCLNYTYDWADGDITQIVTKHKVLNSSYISDEVELKRLQNSVITFTDWNDDITTCTQRDRLVDIVYNNKDDIQKIYY